MQIYSRTDIGKLRSSNQDACFTEILSETTAIAIVCDGMGGAKAGNVASETAIKVMSEYVKNSYRQTMNTDDIAKMLKSAVASANIVIYNMSVNDENMSGMGTTVVAAVITPDCVIVCHVGDSRAYLYSNGMLSQLTRDHSMVQSLVESGKLTPEQARAHPRKNIITRALGAEEDVLPEVGEYDISAGDTVLLCSDGLSNFVEPDNMADIIKNNDLSKVSDVLTDTANQNGGGDNITVVTVTL